MSPESRLDDARAFLALIGGAPLGAPRPAPRGLIEIGHRGAVPCWWGALTSHDVVSVGRRLARSGQVALVIADDPTADTRTLLVTVAPVRAACLPRATLDATIVARLRREPRVESRLAAALALAAALDLDAAGRRAFRRLRTGMDRAIDALPLKRPRTARHGWVLLQVTRLLFLRFVEAEGWLDGRRDFLIREFDRCLPARGDPGAQFLAPLFFGTLNRPVASRSRRASGFGCIPFLNGGLFEPHPLERRHRWALSREGWIDLFELVTTGFEVTLDRGDVGDRVNPELLGRVFEGVMAPEERKATGAFYTPTDLVTAILRSAVISHVAVRLGRTEAAIERALDDRDPPLERALLTLRILDPAVGSGAFLLGALELVCGAERASSARVRHVITRRLFGIDRNPAAVRLTELRLWLALLRAMRGCAPSQVAPLPNLDTAVRAGDALLDPFAGQRVARPLAARLAMVRKEVATCHGRERRDAVVRLRRLEVRVAKAALLRRTMVLRETIADLRDQLGTPDLFGARHRPAPAIARSLRTLARELEGVRRCRRRLEEGGDVAAFGIESAFAPVLARGGFDLVVGNPPWLRGDHLPRRERAALTARYRWWRHPGGGAWPQLPDLSIAFLERGLELVSPQGTLAFLVPRKLVTAGYAAGCRAALAHQATLHTVADLEEDPRAGFDATTYPLAMVLSRRRPPEHHRVRLALGPGQEVPQREWQDRGSWVLAAPALRALADRLARFPVLGDCHPPALGVKTGANEVFLDPPAALRPWSRPALRGRDVRPLAGSPSTSILWPADERGSPWPTLPAPLAEHFAPQRALLEQRSDHVGGPWWQLFRVHAATQPWRVVWPDIARRLRAAPLIDPAVVPLNTCYVIAVADADEMCALAAWLNSRAIGAVARLLTEPAANGFARFGARAVGRVPLPAPVLADTGLAALGRESWSPAVAAAIDRRAASLLELSQTEQGAIDAFIPPGG